MPAKRTWVLKLGGFGASGAKGLRREALPSFATAVRQDGAAGASAHAKTEAVLAGAPAVAWLESTFSHCYS